MNVRLVAGDFKLAVWSQLVFVCMMLFFVFLGDAIMSDWVPAYIQKSVGSPLLMGLILAFSSIVGFLADLVLPQFLKKVVVAKMMLFAIVASLIFGLTMLTSVYLPILAVFLTGMAVWGMYYEFLGFGGQAFVSSTVSAHFRAGAWSILGAFRGLAYFLGPILGSSVALKYGDSQAVLMAMFFIFVGLLIWLVKGRIKKDYSLDMGNELIVSSVFIEFKHWLVLLKSVWPIVTIGLLLGLLDATFWTTGTVLSDNLAEKSFWGGMFLPFYELPMIFMGLLIAKLGIYKGKKKLAEFFVLICGILLIFLSLSNSLWLMLIISFLVGISASFCWPLKDAVFSDVVNRMGIEGKHMIGLSGSTASLAYVLGP
ncbi:hypothetical protein A2572_03975, partial [Candidatus Collierbacteria bacterium RIFOXYD1_FULL_40_9]